MCVGAHKQRMCLGQRTPVGSGSLPFYCVGSGNYIQIVSLVSKNSHPLSHLTDPHYLVNGINLGEGGLS